MTGAGSYTITRVVGIIERQCSHVVPKPSPSGRATPYPWTMEFDRQAIDALAPAIEAARRALRRFDDDDVPSLLARVHRHSGGTLPPPLAKALLGVLDTDPDLRAKAAEEAPEDGPAHWFLRRPDGWDRRIGDLLEDRADAARDRAIALLRRELAAAEAARSAEADRVEAALRRVRDLERRLAERAIAERESSRAATEPLRTEVAGLRAAETRLTAALEEAGHRIEDLERRLEAARAELLTRRRAAATEAPEAAPPVWTGDGQRLAALLDEVVAAARSRVDASSDGLTGRVPGGEGAGEPDETAVALPPGIRPDQAEAVDAILRWRGSLYIDGYNLSGALGADPGDPAAGRSLVRAVVGRLRRRASGGLDVVVVYDSSTGAERKGDEVYVSDADDELRRLAQVAPSTTVVVSDDREVIAGVDAAGATAIWSAAVVEWASRR